MRLADQEHMSEAAESDYGGFTPSSSQTLPEPARMSISSLVSQNESDRKEIAKLIERVGKLEKEKSGLQSALDELKTKLTQTEEERDASQAAYQRTEGDVARVRADYETALRLFRGTRGSRKD
ncbi:uncharacterized protein MKK02DRAFT_40301 [Dioszegia hungarica]|uniref:Uncharacterized protein n=1 Tax=Dioszegia hungarica TaxID=4972 RepID=A0AA38LTT1_9TREE|nr:uncharacterized protein MKK02DRAFT_40301 [Dioszegia hungarica]KAI9632926.1 hypothetical protein MKK02DRAFT_40301 [Dioszegia hungarica]